MRQTWFSIGFAAVAAAASLSASSVYGVDNDSAGAPDARAWLKKTQAAAQKLNYSGTFVYQQGSLVRTSRITHVAQGKDEMEKLETLDGTPREYIRNNDDIVYYMPEAKMLLVEKRVAHEVFPAILDASPSELEERYDIRNGGSGRVAGLDCQIITLLPKDNYRYGYRLWVDGRSGLLLRAQTIGENAEVIEQIAFAQIAIGNIDRSRVKASIANTGGWRVEKAWMSEAHLPGLTIKWVPPGFKKIREIKRTVSGGGHESGGNASTGQREFSQIVFSDGLAAISVFVEPDGVQHHREGVQQQGAMNVVGKRQGDFWLTIVGEVPSAAIKQVANSVEFTSR